jgi:solute carrier family 35 (UDP-sugar transporter), member A1/2/3
LHTLQSGPAESRYEPATAIILAESLKLTVSCGFVAMELRRQPSIAIPAPFLTTITNGHHRAAVPAAFYTIAMISQAVGASSLDLLPYLMLSQLKIIITPFVSALLLNQKFLPRQWLFVFLITTGIVLVELGSAGSSKTEAITTSRSPKSAFGAAVMVLSGCCIALSNVYAEMVLKSSSMIMVRNAQLGVYSCMFATLTLLWRAPDLGNFFHGYHSVVWILVMIQSAGGFLVAWCVWLTSAVTKNYAQSLGFVMASTVPILSHPEFMNLKVNAISAIYSSA